MIVPYINGRSANEIYVPEYSAKTPHVLAFEIRPVAISINLRRYDVFANLKILRNIKFRRCPAVLAVSDLLTVNPKIKCRINSVKNNKCFLLIPSIWNGKIATITSDRVPVFVIGKLFVRLAHNTRRVLFKRIDSIGIHRRSMPLQLPVGGDFDITPFADIVFGVEKIIRLF